MRIVRINPKATWQVLAITLLGLVLCLWQAAIPAAWAGSDADRVAGFGGRAVCSATTIAALRACHHEIRDDLWIAIGSCGNLADDVARVDCVEAAKATFRENNALCRDQYDARSEVCDALGEAAYGPQLDPEAFVDFDAVVGGAPFAPNPFFPLTPGVQRVYKVSDDESNKLERIKVEVLDRTKEILGISCIVVRDRVWEFDEEGERELIEDTLDWYAQDLEGNVWYMGEIAKNYEDGELVDVAGSWKAGRDLAQAGILMPADPQAGRWYRQEFLLGEAEDMAEVVDVLDEVIVRGIIYHNVLQTRDFTPIQPDVLEYKYYAPGIGPILEVNPEDGERVELVRLQTP